MWKGRMTEGGFLDSWSALRALSLVCGRQHETIPTLAPNEGTQPCSAGGRGPQILIWNMTLQCGLLNEPSAMDETLEKACTTQSVTLPMTTAET